jgi:hypothetical protein
MKDGIQTTTQKLEGKPSQAPASPDQVAALAQAEKLRIATKTYNYLFSSELKAPE